MTIIDSFLPTNKVYNRFRQMSIILGEFFPEIGMQPAAEGEEGVTLPGGVDAVGQKQHPEARFRLHHQAGAGKASVAETSVRNFGAEKAAFRPRQLEAEPAVGVHARGIVMDGFFHSFLFQIPRSHLSKHGGKANTV